MTNDTMRITYSTDPPPLPFSHAFRWLGVILCVLSGISLAVAGTVEVADGTLLHGKAVFVDTLGRKPIKLGNDQSPNLIALMVEESGVVRHFVPRLRVKSNNPDNEPLTYERFVLRQPKDSSDNVLAQLGAIVQATPWSPLGRRGIKIRTGKKEVDIVQGITELTPKYSRVSSLKNLTWTCGIPTRSIPVEELDAILRTQIKADNPDDRFAVARCYLEGMWDPQAQAELDSIRKDFPDLKERIDTLNNELLQLVAEQVLEELKARRDAGQYQLVASKAQQFPTQNVSGAVLLELRQILQKTTTDQQSQEEIRDQLGKLQAELSPELASRVAPYRSQISEQLSPAVLERLSAYQNLAQANNLKAPEKLALALSGWLLGPEAAVTELEQALRFWEAQLLILAYLRADFPQDRQARLEELRNLEGIGPEQVAKLIKYLPPITETPNLQSGTPIELETPAVGDDALAAKYVAILPPEYRPGRAYPAIVALHAQGVAPQREAEFWAGTSERPGSAQRFGYIVLCPEYARGDQPDYDYGHAGHLAVMETLKDARRRFHLDSDRIFLAGHGMGADAAFDIGLTHPDLFAGVMPIAGMCEKFSAVLSSNGKYIPFYIIGGELDRDSVVRSANSYDSMMKYGYPTIYSEFIGRGHEDFHSEIPRLFDWMSRQKRQIPRDFEVRILRPTDKQFWWWSFGELPSKFGLTSWPTRKGEIRPLILAGDVAPGANKIRLTGGAKQHALWLYPGLIDFQQRLVVSVNGGQKYNDFPQPNISAMLEDFRLRGDRQHLAWAYLDLSRSGK